MARRSSASTRQRRPPQPDPVHGSIICHGGLVAISAGIIGRDRSATGSLGIRDDLVNAGARFVDEPALRDGNLVWGRVVDDIPAFERELVALFAEHHRPI